MVEVTRQGGYVLSVTDSRTAGAATLTQKEGVKLAKRFLSRRDIKDMDESYFIQRDNCLTINFAARQGNVVCYPDLIKVKVALDNGEIVGFESAGYLMNHTRRDSVKPRISVEKARKVVSPELRVESTRLAVIPTRGKQEKLCWEFRCITDEGQHCMVYIGAESGQEEQILLLLEDESGTLTV
jgi:germination protein YpeB